MWPFDVIEKRRLRKMFGTMVSPDVLKHLEDHPESFQLSPREGDFGFVVVQVAEGDLHRTRELVGRVVDLASSHKAFVGQIISSIVMCHYGVIQNTDLSPCQSSFLPFTINSGTTCGSSTAHFTVSLATLEALAVSHTAQSFRIRPASLPNSRHLTSDKRRN